jgi:hypothetical protein
MVKGDRYLAFVVLKELVALGKAGIEDVGQSSTVRHLEDLRNKARGLSAPVSIFELSIFDRTEIVPRSIARWQRGVGWMASSDTVGNRRETHSFVTRELWWHLFKKGKYFYGGISNAEDGRADAKAEVEGQGGS